MYISEKREESGTKRTTHRRKKNNKKKNTIHKTVSKRHSSGRYSLLLLRQLCIRNTGMRKWIFFLFSQHNVSNIMKIAFEMFVRLMQSVAIIRNFVSIYYGWWKHYLFSKFNGLCGKISPNVLFTISSIWGGNFYFLVLELSFWHLCHFNFQICAEMCCCDRTFILFPYPR